MLVDFYFYSNYKKAWIIIVLIKTTQSHDCSITCSLFLWSVGKNLKFLGNNKHIENNSCWLNESFKFQTVQGRKIKDSYCDENLCILFTQTSLDKH